ncbi:chemotaxis protein CheA [Haloimpatiens lingqiaonensis]|uniref:chemotaxis protein CheA n=1 Tax=Haloimpatiens lingqiaonensis TaxID=1380675 RepID=UPI0010FDD0C5|nr:chemotaxis protein CheA [Haloimpatiens lingqiaonensis]
MDTSQYMSMFLEESMDNLQVLNDSLLQLEQDPEDIDKLNEIFRIAHTLKGMSATMGFNNIADLTHKMEDVLAEFREGSIKADQKVVTILFKCLDTLERMISNISEGVDEDVPIEHIIEQLHSLTEHSEITDKDEKKDLDEESFDEEVDEEVELELDEYELSVIKQAKDRAYKAYKIHIFLNENTLLKSARAFLIFKDLEDYGEIIKSVPCTEDIESEDFDLSMALVYLTKRDKEEVHNSIMNISEVEKVTVMEIDNSVKHCEKSQTPKAIEKNIKNEGKAQKNKASNDSQNHQRKNHQSVRVDLERLDKFMNMVSELVIHRTKLEQIGEEVKMPELNETLEQVARTTSDLQDLVMKIRMLPLEVVFSRFPRMIRDLSVELNKEMELIIEGQETELDRTVIDEIGEPLIHLLRNAADHGIEDKEERIKKGKEPVGKIKLVAYQEGTKAVIKVSDDGKGLDPEKIREKAEKLGIKTEGMTDSDINNLIFMQGFSTNEEVTDISGRGVGMDVVKTKISSLGGTLDLVSEIDKGTTFIITLPLTLQIIQALLVKIGEETMAISLGYIDRVIDYKEEKIKKSNNKEVIVYSDKVIPLIRVNEKLGIPYKKEGKKYIIIVKVGEKTAGLLVDSLLGQQEIVIKPLGKTLQSLKEYIGATILGGTVTLILDVSSLV